MIFLCFEIGWMFQVSIPLGMTLKNLGMEGKKSFLLHQCGLLRRSYCPASLWLAKQPLFPCIFLVVTECLFLMAETSGSLRNQVILLLGTKASCRIGVGFRAALSPRWQPLRVWDRAGAAGCVGAYRPQIPPCIFVQCGFWSTLKSTLR